MPCGNPPSKLLVSGPSSASAHQPVDTSTGAAQIKQLGGNAAPPIREQVALRPSDSKATPGHNSAHQRAQGMVPHTHAEGTGPRTLRAQQPETPRDQFCSPMVRNPETNKTLSRDFPGYPVVKTQLQMQGDWVSSLLEELEPHPRTKINDPMCSN